MGVTGLALMAGAVVIYRHAQRETSPPAASAAVAPSVAPPVETPDAASAPPPTTRPESAAEAERPATRRAGPATRVAATSPVPSNAPPPATIGTLTITADVDGTQVFLDRQFIGATPVTAADVPPGSHQLHVSAPGYDPIVQTIDVSPGPRDIAIRFREVRLNVVVDVVHKHRLGSCRGRLVATPQGLRYETSDKDDAFSAGLLDLEIFQVDYLAKILRVQARRGRRYEFTDPEGNADRLFVFHRDVDNARNQLRKGDTP
jgi:hypothetical protein